MSPKAKWIFFLKKKESATKQCARNGVYLLPWEKCWFLKMLGFIGQKLVFLWLHDPKRRVIQIPENYLMVQTVCLIV